MKTAQGKEGERSSAQGMVLLVGTGSAGFAGVFLLSGSTCWHGASLYSECSLFIY